MALNYTLELLHFSDQEAATGAFLDAPGLSAVLNALRAEDLFNDGIADNTLFVSSGDGFIPSLFYTASNSVYGAVGIGDILMQNAMGLQVSAFGNHEFDTGVADLANLINGTRGINFTGTAFPYLSCNLNFTPEAALNPLQVPRFLPPLPRRITSSVVFTVGGESIGVVGATTPTLRSITSAGNVVTLPQPFNSPPSDAELNALAAIIQGEVNGLIAANSGMNKVILLAHMQSLAIEFALAQRLRNVDIIVAGGSHTRLFDANDRIRAGDSNQGEYPRFFRDLDNKTVAVVNTDANYKYLGRLVIGFDAAGNLIPSTYNATVSGAYATDAQGVAFVNSTGNAIVNPVVADVVRRIEAQVATTTSNILGFSNVFLNGNRGALNDPNPTDGVRTQETNLGDLTADANLWYARFFDPAVTISIKNGGGIRNNIGVTTVLANSTSFSRLPNEELKLGNGTVLRPFGGISQNDIANALSFNNALALVTVTRTELKSILEYGIAELRAPNGRMCQVGGVQFTFDSLAPAGSRIITLRITSVSPPILVVSNGAIVGNASDTFRVVTLGFLLDNGSGTGGDGYVFPLTGRSNLTSGGTGRSSFAAPGTEQDAMAEFLLQFHNSSANAYNQVDTDRRGDLRMSDISFNPSYPVAYTLELLHFSDQEAATGAFLDAPGLSAVLNALRAEDLFNDGIADNTLFVSSGDGFIPSLFYTASNSVYGAVGIGDILMQNAMGLQVSAFGNHEFDTGVADLANLINGTRGINFTGTAFPYLSCNLNFTPEAALNPLQVPRFLPPLPRRITSSVVFTVGGESIGVVGATTPTLRSITSAGNVVALPQPFNSPPSDAELNALAAIIQGEVNGLIAANFGMNKVILLAHMQSLAIEFALAQRLRNVDIIVAGGSHTRLFDANDRIRAGDSNQGEYPRFFRDLDNKTVAVVNTDANYKYLGRLVIGFDAAGNLIPSTYNATVSGAYATDAQGVAFVNSTGNAIVNPVVADVVRRIEAQVATTTSNILGFSNVFLNGNRGALNDPNPTDGVRTQETNLGDLTADANLWYARFFDPAVTISIKNGGGIRNNIGVTTVLANSTSFSRLPNEELKLGNGTVLRPFGGISQNDIANALSFNNALALVTVTRTELKSILEYGIAELRAPNGRMCQVGGVQFTFDSLAPAGSRIITLRITSVSPPILVVSNGAIVGNASDTFRVVTLGFLLDNGSGTGGDGYVFPLTGRSNLTSGGTGRSSFAAPGTEQDAMAEFLLQFHNSSANAYNQVDTDRSGDLRMFDLSFNPSKAPTKAPTKAPIKAPTKAPIKAPTKAPAKAPTDTPSQSPSARPVKAPVKAPAPVAVPLPISVPVPAIAPIAGNGTAPVKAPASAPATTPVTVPVTAPATAPVTAPINVPVRPPVPVPVPVRVPAKSPTKVPSKTPTVVPTRTPTTAPVRKNCGLFGLSIFCPTSRCGLLGRLLRICVQPSN